MPEQTDVNSDAKRPGRGTPRKRPGSDPAPVDDPGQSLLRAVVPAFLGFLDKYFGHLPMPARVLAYFVVLFTVVLFAMGAYFSVFERTISGQIVVPANANGTVTQPLEKQVLILHLSPRVVRAETDPEGFWVVPRLHVFPVRPPLKYVWRRPGCENRGCEQHIQVSLDLIPLITGGSHELLLIEDPKDPKLPPQIMTASEFRASRPVKTTSSFPFAAAHAQAVPSLPARERVPQAGPGIGVPDVRPSDVQRILSNVGAGSSVSPSRIEALSTTQKAVTKRAIEDVYGVVLPADRWSAAKGLDDILALVKQSPVVTSGDGVKVRQVLRSYQERKLFVDPEFRPEFQEKLATIRASLRVPPGERVVAFLDGTVFGAADEGFVFGEQGVYFRSFTFTRRYIGSISYADLLKAPVAVDGPFRVAVADQPSFSLAGTGMSNEKFAELLNKVKQALAQEQPRAER